MKVIIGLIAAFVFLTILVALALLLANQQQNTNTLPTSSPSSIPTLKPTIKPTPTSTPTHAPTPTPSINIAISYSNETVQSIVEPLGVDYPKSGKVFLVVNMTIRNNGYDRFSANTFYFHVIVDKVNYNVDRETYVVNNWNTTDVLNGGIFKGTLVFQIPANATSFTLGYGLLANYNIVWTEI